jgi:ribosomal protein S18 acetylase RimI-like enzyme
MSDIRHVSADHPAAAPLLAGLRQEYFTLYGAAVEPELDRYAAMEFHPPQGAFLILEADGVTLAGGALRKLADGIGEIKRMWTAPAQRGRGYGRRVLAALEDAAVHRGYRSLRLETGDLQHAAIALYASAGYRETAPYGPRLGDPRLVCLGKALA